jgi:DNA primase
MIEDVRKINMLVLLKHLEIIPVNASLQTRFSCLFHQSNSGLSADINHQNKVWCWSCGKTFDVLDIYQQHSQKDFQKSLEYLYHFYHSNLYQEILGAKNILKETERIKKITKNNPKIIDEKHILEIKKKIISYVSPIFNEITNLYHEQLLNNKLALKYLTEVRKINLETIKTFKLGLAKKNNNFLFQLIHNKPDKMKLLKKLGVIKKQTDFHYDALVDCLVIPITYKKNTLHFFKHNYHQEIDRFNPKYKALKNFSQTPIFYWPYGFTEAWEEIKKRKKVIIHEGFYDVMNCHQHGIKNVIGLITITNYLSPTIIKLFQKYEIEITLGLDNDESGKNNTKRIFEQLKKENLKVIVKSIPKENQNLKDADDILKKENLKLYQKIYY